MIIKGDFFGGIEKVERGWGKSRTCPPLMQLRPIIAEVLSKFLSLEKISFMKKLH